jgi:uncharacterized repeat protein (TIGR04052 family)
VIRASIAAAALFALAACEHEQPIGVEFRATAGGASIGCDGAPLALTDLRFYVHDVMLLTADGAAVPLHLDQTAPWQTDRVALVDLEDGTNGCRTGSAEARTIVTGRATAGDYQSLSFTLGVPFDLNHANPVEAKAPLDQTVMHWHWQAGYKFLRAGIVEDGRQTWVHIGSTGCRGRVGAIEACARPNRVTVTVRGFDPATDIVTVDVGALFKNAVGDTEAHCMAEQENPVCAAIFANLEGAEVFGRAQR